MGHRRHRQIDQPILSLATHPAAHVTVDVIAEYLEVHRNTIMAMIQAGTLHAFKVGREWRIPTDELRRAFPSRNGDGA